MSFVQTNINHGANLTPSHAAKCPAFHPELRFPVEQITSPLTCTVQWAWLTLHPRQDVFAVPLLSHNLALGAPTSTPMECGWSATETRYFPFQTAIACAFAKQTHHSYMHKIMRTEHASIQSRNPMQAYRIMARPSRHTVTHCSCIKTRLDAKRL